LRAVSLRAGNTTVAPSSNEEKIMDTDLEQMTREQLIEEVKKLQQPVFSCSTYIIREVPSPSTILTPF
jgi:hypothetical protein